MPTFFERLQHGWNAFRGRDRPNTTVSYGEGSYYRPDRQKSFRYSDRSIVTAIYNRIAVDVASNTIQHVKVDKNGRYLETVEDGLNNCLTLEANIDQTSEAFIRDLTFQICKLGCVAVVPVDTSINPAVSASYDIRTMRVAEITQWFPEHVTVRIYNDRTGRKEEITLPKKYTGIIENPFYEIMNEPNSTLQRLIRKLALMDNIDEQTSAGKLDLIIQLPYLIKSEARKQQAENRRKDIEMQLRGSKYGIAYTDGTERIVQLNRPLENNLLGQIEYLTKELYAELGITPEILNGTADERVMLNYNSRIIEPILSAIVGEFKRKFLTKTARTQGQSILFNHDPFKLVPISSIAQIADTFTRNEILSSNELRGIIGFRPSDDQRADMLLNKNMPIQAMPGVMPGQEQDPNAGGDLQTDPNTGMLIDQEKGFLIDPQTGQIFDINTNELLYDPNQEQAQTNQNGTQELVDPNAMGQNGGS